MPQLPLSEFKRRAVQAAERNRPPNMQAQRQTPASSVSNAWRKAAWAARTTGHNLVRNPGSAVVDVASRFLPLGLGTVVRAATGIREPPTYEHARTMAQLAVASFNARTQRFNGGGQPRPGNASVNQPRQDVVFAPQAPAANDRQAGFGERRPANPAQAKPQEVWKPREAHSRVNAFDYARMRAQGQSAHTAHAPTNAHAAAHTQFAGNFGGSVKPGPGVRARGR